MSKLIWTLFCFGLLAGLAYWFYINMEELLDEKREEDMIIEAHHYFEKYSKDNGLTASNDDEFEAIRDAFTDNYLFVKFYGKKKKLKFELNQFAHWQLSEIHDLFRLSPSNRDWK